MFFLLLKINLSERKNERTKERKKKSVFVTLRGCISIRSIKPNKQDTR